MKTFITDLLIFKKKRIVEQNWRKRKKEVIDILNTLNLKTKDVYFCYISFFGPQGQYKYPNIINLRVSNSKDLREGNETIAREFCIY